MDALLKLQLARWLRRALWVTGITYLVCLPAIWWIVRYFCLWGDPPTPGELGFWCKLFRVAVSFTGLLLPWFGLVFGWITHGVVSDVFAAKHRPTI